MTEATRHALAPTYGDAPTQCFGSPSIAEIHSPPAVPFGPRFFGSPSLQSVSKHPLYADASLDHQHRTRKLLAALGYQPRTSTSLSLPSGLTEFTAKCMMCETMLGSTEDFVHALKGDPLRNQFEYMTSVFPFAKPNEPDLCFNHSPAHRRCGRTVLRHTCDSRNSARFQHTG